MRCMICEKGCTIIEGNIGSCGLYTNEKGKIVERFPNQYIITCPISMETMPILHFHPGEKILQISTTGCNFSCNGCISTVIVKEMTAMSKALQQLSPEEVVEKAIDNGCKGIAFLMNDPLAAFQTFVKVAKIAKEKGLTVGCSSNAYFTEDALNEISPYLDFINVGVKGLSNKVYYSCGGSTVKPVLRNIKKLYEKGVHVEISCIYQKNKEEEMIQLAQIIAELSKDIPLQVMRFIPLEGADPSLEPSIYTAEQLCKTLRKYLNYVYLFNSPGTDDLNTFCPDCHKLIYRRDFYGPMGAKLKLSEKDKIESNRCSYCGKTLAIKTNLKKENSQERNFKEDSFQGGYPFTRALEIMESMLITMGIHDQKKLMYIWEDVLRNNKLSDLHHAIQSPVMYIKTIRSFGEKIQENQAADALASYMNERLERIQKGIPFIQKRPRVYYAMGKPLFLIKGERLENQLVETAGGISVNKEIAAEGRPGMNISAEQLNALNPEAIFISAFISSPVKDFYSACYESGIHVDAVKQKRIYTYPSPGWDFGSPRWILGLMYMANILHPDIYDFNMAYEAENFYNRFYNMAFSLSQINRSFSKPNNQWKWESQIS